MLKVRLKVKELLIEKGISQKELSKMTGIRESTVSEICRGTKETINKEHISKIAETLGITEIGQIIEFR